jgi:cell division protein FtsB
MERQHTYESKDLTLREKPRTPTRHERQFVKKLQKRELRRRARKALHGLSREGAPPSLLQAIRLNEQVQKKHAELEKIFAAQRAQSEPAPAV